MHLRTKLTLGVVVATLAAFVAVGFVAIPTAKRAVRDRVDDRLLADISDFRSGAEDGRTSVGDQYAVIVVSPTRTFVRSMTGSVADPDSPPDVPLGDVPSEGEVAYAAGADGTLYRIAALDLGGRRSVVVGAPVDDLRGLVDDLTRQFLIIALVAGALLAVVARWWIRRTARPIEALTIRADAIASGDPDRSLLVATNTTELTSLVKSLDAMVASVDAALADAARSESALREFLANASHELRTPLTSVSGYLQLDLDGALADPTEHRRAIARAVCEAARMARLVSDMQLLAELDEPEAIALRIAERIDVAALARDAVEAMEVLDASRSWEVHVPLDPLVIRGDADQLRQVFGNLLANVRAHTPPGTHTAVTVTDLGDDVAVVVADTGPGLADEHRGRAFDRFWRLDISRSRSSGGSGLGLAIVAAIARAHGGDVRADVTPPHGLTVRVRLSREAPPSPRTSSSTSRTARSTRWEASV